jgi:hypothetical protein
MMNAAYRLLARQMSLADAAAELSHANRISLRHAYRYLEEAAKLRQPLEIAEPTEPVTFKIPGDTVRALRAYAALNNLTLSEIVTRAIEDLLARARRYG